MKNALVGPVMMLLGLICAQEPGHRQNPASDPPDALEYVVDLTDRSDDTFKVTLRVDDLLAENGIYQFASTAPGTYQVMDMGRFVRSFTALDADGDNLSVERISTNQWQILEPESVVEIRYHIAETWDTPVDENPIYVMCGTSIEDDHVQINGQAVFGYPTGMQNRPLQIQLEKPADWVVGTAMQIDESGRYLAMNYDHVVDSPILAGRLSLATTQIANTEIDVYTYSKTDLVHSESILGAVESILEASGQYLGTLPVDRYTFLFHFEDAPGGAWEHSYSSTYTFPEAAFDQLISSQIPNVVAHEFLHIVTPLNIHSDVIEQFNFVNPTPSEHVWLYEGVTEWMAHTSQLRAGLIDLDDYLVRLTGKLRANDLFDSTFSLSDISLESYSERGQREWGNIYQRGAVVATLLDIKLLALSDGQQGLRELILELARKYGPDEAFDEATFFDEIIEMTYPEVRPFLENYIRDTKPLPLRETFDLVGIEYVKELPTGEQVDIFDVQFRFAFRQILVGLTRGSAAECGLSAGDVVMTIDGQDISPRTSRQMRALVEKVEVGQPFTLGIERAGQELRLTCERERTEQIEYHVLRVDPDASPEQVALREKFAS